MAGALLASLVDPSTVGTGPDQRVALAVLVVEKVGVDRGVEARIVQLQAQILAALVGAFGPGGADFRAADHNTVAGGVLAGGAQVGDDAHAFRLNAEGDDVAGELVRAGLFEAADGRHVEISIFGFEPAPCGLDGDRPAGGDRRRIACDRSKAEDGAGAVFLSREEWVKPRGRKLRRTVAAQTVEASAVLRPDQAIEEVVWSARRRIDDGDDWRPFGALRR